MPAESLTAAFLRLHRRMRCAAVAGGAAWSVAAAAVLVLAACLADWWLHVDDPRHRAAMLAACGLIWGAVLIRNVLIPAFRRYRAVDTALRIEQLQPHWQGALASSVEFLAHDCRPDEGAPQLQRALITRAERRVYAAGLPPLIDTRRLKLATGCALLALLLAGGAALADRASAQLALARLFTPYSAAAWPRRHTLVLLDSAYRPLDPTRPTQPSAAGERLVIYVDDLQAGLPDPVVLHLVEPGGSERRQPLERTTVSDGRGRRREIAVAVLPSTAPRLQVRATGGDDQRMPWHSFRFAPRPQVRRLTVRLAPPDYTRQPPQTVVTTGGDIEALVGTRVRLDAEFARPVTAAEFHHEGLPPESTSLAADGRTFSVEFAVSSAERGVYWFGLVDASGLPSVDPPRYAVHPIVDREPTVALTHPTADTTVTPQAVVPLQVHASDDLGLAYVRLLLSEPPGSAGEIVRPLTLSEPLPREASPATEIAIGELGLEAGRRLMVRAEVADAFDLDGRHVVRSVARTLSIVAPEEKLRELVSRQAAIAQDLERAHDLQSRSLRQTLSLQLQWQTAASFSAEDLDLLRRISHDQTQIAAILHDEQRGTEQQSRFILAELAWNRLSDEATSRRLALLERELSRLRREIAPALVHGLSQAGKQAALADEGASGQLAATLAEVADRQAAAAALLDELAAQFAQWQQHYDLTRRLAEIVAEQELLNEQTRELGRRTLTSQFDRLPAEDRAALARLGQRQAQAAAALEEFRQRLQQAATRTTGEGQTPSGLDPQRALRLLDEEPVLETMRQAAQFITRNAIPQAATAQQGVREALSRLEGMVRASADPEPETLVRRVEAAQAEAESLQRRQEALLDQARTLAQNGAANAAATLPQLQAQQESLAEDAGGWAQRLRRQSIDSSHSAADAARAMQDAAAHLAPDTLPQAATDQQQAVDALLQLRRELAALRRQLEIERTLSEWARVAAMLEVLARRQEHLRDETARLNEEQLTHRRLTRSQLRTLQDLAAAQAQLASDVEQLRQTSGGSAVVSEALAPTVENMHSAADRLSQRLVDEETQRAQTEALDRLRVLRTDLAATSAAAQPQPAPDAAASTDAEPAARWPLAVQLMILMRLQADIARQTEQTIAAVPDGERPDADQQRQLQELADRQLRLAGLLDELLGADGPREESLP